MISVGVDSYMNLLPEYPIFAKFFGHSPLNLLQVLSSISSFEDLVSVLSKIEPQKNNVECYEIEHDVRMIVQNGFVISILFNTIGQDGTTRYYAVGSIEYVYTDNNGLWKKGIASLDREKTKEMIPEYEKISKFISERHTIENVLLVLEQKKDTYDYLNGWRILVDIADNIHLASHLEQEQESIDLGDDDIHPLICIKSPESQRCDDNDGIPVCVALVSEKKWNKMLSLINMFSKSLSCIEEDYSSGGHGCVIAYDIPEMISQCKVISNLSLDTISFIKMIEDRTFIEFIENVLHNEIEKMRRSL